MANRVLRKPSSPSNSSAARRLPWGRIGFAAVLAAAIIAAYGRGITTPFIFDDASSVVENPSIVRLWPLVGDDQILGPLNPPKDLPTSGRPLVNWSLAVNYFFGGVKPVGYHAFNLILHWLSALLVMAIVGRTLALEFFGGRFARVVPWLAFVTALFWAIHPLQTETVVYTTQRTELMVGFFYLMVFHAALKYWSSTDSPRRRIWLAVAALASMAGMACKEVMVTAPVLVLLFERTFITGSFRKSLRQSWPLYFGLFASWGLLIWLNYDGPRAKSAGFDLGVPAVDWWFTQAKMLWVYLKLVVWPWPLSIHYPLPQWERLWQPWPWVIMAATFVVATALLFWRRCAAGFVGAWVLVILSPTMIIPIITEAAAERRMYLPLAAIVALFVAGGYRLLQKIGEGYGYKTAIPTGLGRRLPVTGAMATVLLVITWISVDIHRLAAYRDSLTLWQDTIATQPNDAVAHDNFGVALNNAGRFSEAIAEQQIALNLNPNYPEAYNDLGLSLMNAGHRQEALEQFRTALKLSPQYDGAYYNLGKAYADEGELEQAQVNIEKALDLNPNNFGARNNLVLCHNLIFG